MNNKKTIFELIKEILRDTETLYRIKASRSFRRDLDEIDDFFMMITFSEIFAIDNPYAYYTLDMLPILMPRYHEWHQKMGLQGAFFENFPCGCCVC